MKKSETSKTQTNNIKWDKNIEDNVKEIGEKAKGYKIMHIQDAYRINRHHKWLMYSAIFLDPLSGLVSLIHLLHL